ncbi:MAG: DUF4249 family protein [Bacteroidales bacterium]|nr:DUF4249 family protein [Bacteroidales bacterium]
MKRVIRIILVFSIFLNSCEFLISDYSMRKSDIVPEIPAQKVITFATYFSGEGLEISLSQPMDLIRPLSKKIGVTRLTLYKTGSVLCLDTTVNFEAGRQFFKINSFSAVPEAGDSIIIKVDASGFDEVSGSTIIPLPASISSINSTKITSSEDFYRFTISFSDHPVSNDFYLVSAIYYLTQYSFPMPGYGNIYDTLYSEERKQVPLSDPVFNFMPDYRTSIKEPFSSSDLKPRVFSDKVFNGSDYSLKIEVPVRKDANALVPNKKYFSEYEVELYSISKDLFAFITSSFTNEIIEDDIYAQPIVVYSNMSNKAGFFGAVSKASKARQAIEPDDLLKFDFNN